jgi:hypothetical protein
MHAALQKSAAGLEFMTPLNEMLKKSASDEIADGRFQRSLDGINARDMYRRAFVEVGDAQKLHIENPQLILKGESVVWTSLLDVMEFTIDAFKMWSQVRIQEKRSEVITLVQNLSLETVDLTLAWLLFDMVNQPLAVFNDDARDPKVMEISCIQDGQFADRCVRRGQAAGPS